MSKSPQELRVIRDSVERIGRLSDGLVRFGPFRLGIDGVLSWVPVIGELYSAGAAAFILGQGVRAEVPWTILAGAGVLLASRTAITAVPLAGPAAADLFTAHRWAAAMVMRAIDQKLAGTGTPRSPDRPGYWSSRLTRLTGAGEAA